MVVKTRLLLCAVVIWAMPLVLHAAAPGVDRSARDERAASGDEVRERERPVSGAREQNEARQDEVPQIAEATDDVARQPAAQGGSSASGLLRQGCVASHLIRRVSFDDDRTGTLELVGNQKIRLTLRNACSGIRFNGYVHRPVNRRFCEGDMLRVMGSGGFCVVDTLEPLADDTLPAQAVEQSTDQR